MFSLGTGGARGRVVTIQCERAFVTERYIVGQVADITKMQHDFEQSRLEAVLTLNLIAEVYEALTQTQT